METNMKYDLLPLEEGDEDYIDHKIDEYDESIVPPDPADADETIVLKIADDGNLVAGLIFNIGLKIMWLHVLWVDERYRRQGFASMLIRKAEQIAREKNCCLSIVGSFDFQAKPFYEKQGKMRRKDIRLTIKNFRIIICLYYRRIQVKKQILYCGP